MKRKIFAKTIVTASCISMIIMIAGCGKNEEYASYQEENEETIENTDIDDTDINMSSEESTTLTASEDVSIQTVTESQNDKTSSSEQDNSSENDTDKKDVSLESDQIIEAESYIDSEEECYRVSIGRKESVEGEYDHVKDCFFVNVDGKEISFEVEYPSKTASMDTDRYVFDACDFEAEYVDVTFDGQKDVVISLGHVGASGDMAHCVYVYEDGEFVYVKSFENIPNYSINEEEKCIEGVVNGEKTKYTYSDKEFVCEG